MAQTPHVLEVPGARLHYEVCGSGPVLLLIPGGAADSSMFAGMVPLLADDYTVVTYDPRGLSRSTRDDAARDIPVEVQADDVHRLLAAITTNPALVFANSGGAITALELITQHPDQVHILIAHEPPLTELLPDSARHRAAVDDLYDTYRSDGAGPARTKFFAVAGMTNGPRSADAQPPVPSPGSEPSARIQRNIDLFFAHMLRPITSYRPDVAALRAVSPPIVVAGGTDSTGQLAHRTAVALADLLGTTTVDFPGDHGGFASQPHAFAETLRQVLTETT